MDDFLKRLFDLVVSFLALLILVPIFLVIALLIKIDSKGPVFFKQTRIGKGNKKFKIIKFRTMIVNAEKMGRQITVGNDNRITKVGHYLRKFKLDELPQLLNVFKGDMSFVGPRPEVPRYTKLYTKEQFKVLDVRPGITDYASIKYRNESDILQKSDNPEKTYIEEIMIDKLTINLDYLHRRSFFEDIKIILLTIRSLIK